MEHDDRDEYLMARVQHGQPELLERLLQRHATPLLTFLHRMTGDRHRAEELFQEVFLTLWCKRRQYDYPRPFKPWLYTIALNKCREALRSRRAREIPLTEEPDSAPTAAGGGPAEALISAETAEVVGRAVTALPERQRAVVVLRVWEGLPYSQIAQVLESNEATVRSHMHHGLAALRRYLQPRLGLSQRA